MKKIIFYVILVILSTDILIAQTETKSINNKQIIKELGTNNNKGEKDQRIGDVYWLPATIGRGIYFAAGNVGIGTASPSTDLDVAGTITTTGFIMTGGNSGDVLTYNSLGSAYWTAPSSGQSLWSEISQGIIYNPTGSNANVGIGVDTPNELLHVGGTILTEGGLQMLGSSNQIVFGNETTSTFQIARNLTSRGFSPPPEGSQLSILSINPDNNVGIGINNPGVKLDVNGAIRTNDEYTFNSGHDGLISFGSSTNAQNLKIISNYSEGLKTNINGISITSIGNVGIGIDNPTAKLVVDGKTITNSLQISGGTCAVDQVLTATDENGNTKWTDLNTLVDGGVWNENEQGDVYIEIGNVGIGTPNPESPLDIDFGPQKIGLKFSGIDYGSSTTYSDFNIETNYNNRPELRFKTGHPYARYVWSCGGIDKMTLSIVNYGDPVSNVLKMIDGTIISKKMETETIKIGTSDDINGYTLQANILGESKWVDLWRRSNEGVIHSSDAVGIGTSNVGNHKLVVAGSINAKEILVTETVPGSDYVFESDYSLMPLHELESFVKENKHLPEVMSAKEFAENGYNLGEMDDVLLRKVEELTLYVIQQQKEIEELKSIIKK